MIVEKKVGRLKALGEMLEDGGEKKGRKRRTGRWKAIYT